MDADETQRSEPPEPEQRTPGQGERPYDAEFRRLCATLGFGEDGKFGGRYVLEKALGSGAMGSVHLARDTELGRAVALKRVRRGGLTKSKDLSERLRREAQSLARIRHPNVVAVYDVGQSDGEIYVAMEYVPGVTLAKWQSQEQRGRWETLETYIQAGRGLAAAHARGVVHRDFKPENVLIGDDGGVRVVDFGIAALRLDEDIEPTLDTKGRTEGASAEPPTGEAERLTAAGSIMGTLPYMSPEQLSGARVDARSDQFSYCVALWEALTGVQPFGGKTAPQRILALQEPPRGAKALPRWLRSVLSRGMRREPDERFPDMPALLRALQGRRRKLRLLGAVGVLAVALTVAGGVGWSLAPSSAPHRVESCADFRAEIAEHWGTPRRSKLQAELAKVDPATSTFVVDELDRLSQEWTAAAGAACEGEAGPAPDSRERVCLSTWLDAFDRNVDALASADRDALARAPDLLARLSPPTGDYCAVTPRVGIDSKVAELARAAREAAVLGESERAAELASAALESAKLDRDDPREYTLELAEARLARGEAFAYAGDFEAALLELERAQAHAYGVHDLALATAILRVKSIALGGGSVEVARTLLETAGPMAAKLRLSPEDPRRGELEEGRGLLARAEGDCDRAIEHHERARELFQAAGWSVGEAKSLLNTGACHQIAGRATEAKQAYVEALEVYRKAGVPPSYRNRVSVELNLGQLALAAGDLDGLPHLDAAVRHGSPRSALEALHLGTNLAYAEGDDELAHEWALRSLEFLEASEQVAPAGLAAELRLVVGMILAEGGDPRGLELMTQAEEDVAKLDLETRFRVKRNWIRWSLRRGRCAEAKAKFAELEAMEAEDGSDELEIQTWRRTWQSKGCDSPTQHPPKHPGDHDDRPPDPP